MCELERVKVLFVCICASIVTEAIFAINNIDRIYNCLSMLSFSIIFPSTPRVIHAMELALSSSNTLLPPSHCAH